MQAVVTREIDELGRIVLSAEFRNNLNLETGDEIENKCTLKYKKMDTKEES